MLFIEIDCDGCGKRFTRRKAEVTYNAKKGRRNFCGLNCCGRKNNDHLPKFYVGQGRPDGSGRKIDEFSPFRYHLRMVRQHCKARRRDCGITLDDLKAIWNDQNGICPFTGWKLQMPRSSQKKDAKRPDQASLDRVDHTKGYTPDNVRFVAYIANIARHDFSDDQLVRFCEAVVDRQK